MTNPRSTDARPEIIGAGTPPSPQASWWPTYEFMRDVLAQANVGPLPAAGTPAWLEMADGDPRKLLALAEAGVLHVLSVDCAQTVRAEASSDISGDTDWSTIARRVVAGRGAAYIERKAS